MTRSEDTIAAIATPGGTGGIAVIRISGPDAVAVADRAWRGKPLASAAPRTAHLGILTDAEGSPLDQAVATVFRGPASFTGEDTVELGVHGSAWVQREVLARLCALGARPAEPGEFTRRAFLNGRIDLAQAEGIADLISVSSRAAHRMAMAQATGAFSRQIDALRERLTSLAALLELELDFSEEDVEFADRRELSRLGAGTLGIIDRMASTYRRGRALKEGIPVVIAGAPNAGKSTLLNMLLGHDKAIVTDIAGTTRDLIEDTCEIDGILYRFIDTAGLHDTDDPVERIGIERALRAVKSAAIVIWVVDGSLPPREDDDILGTIAASLGKEEEGGVPVVIIAENKSDMREANGPETSPPGGTNAAAWKKSTCLEAAEGEAARLGLRWESISISALTGEGVDILRARLGHHAGGGLDLRAELMVTNQRHYESLRAGASALRRFLDGLQTLPADLLAQDLRQSLHHLSELTGAVTAPDILAHIFANFCIGK